MTDALCQHEVAKLLGCTVYWIDRLRAQEGFPRPTIKEARSLLWARSDVEKWMEVNEWKCSSDGSGESPLPPPSPASSL